MTTRTPPLATTITGSLPRPHWFTENLRGRPFLTAMGSDLSYCEQYSDAVATLIADQSRAGLDIVSDGEMRFDIDIGGRSWFGYLFDRMTGLGDADVRAGGAEWTARQGTRRRTDTPGDILHEVMQSRMPPLVTGPVGPGQLQYDAIWKTAQRCTHKPVKLGSCSAQMIDKLAVNRFYKDRRETVMALSEALNQEHMRLADAGCPIIQIEEPCVHYASDIQWDVPVETYIEALNLEVRGLRGKTEVWCHTCWGNPAAQRTETTRRFYTDALPYFDKLDVDVLTFEAADNGGDELESFAKTIGARKKIAVGVISHRTLQVERPEEVADLIRRALKMIGPERLIVSTDCGFGRQGMSRLHAFYKMVALTRGTNIVRRELGLPEADILAADAKGALLS
jgi:5-methyltetrahydropteroyltriglutamate--homocysteine methyltransferase